MEALPTRQDEEEEDYVAAPCWTGQLAMGVVLGAVFGVATSVILSRSSADAFDWLGAVPGVVFGSSVAVYAANTSGGEAKRPPSLFACVFAAATIGCLAMGSVFGGMLDMGASIITLAMAASVCSIGVFSLQAKHFGTGFGGRFTTTKCRILKQQRTKLSSSAGTAAATTATEIASDSADMEAYVPLNKEV